MAQKNLVERITLGIVASVIYLSTGVLAGVVLVGCTNPVKDTYGTGVDGGKKAIEKARGAQDKVDESARKTKLKSKKNRQKAQTRQLYAYF